MKTNNKQSKKEQLKAGIRIQIRDIARNAWLNGLMRETENFDDEFLRIHQIENMINEYLQEEPKSP